MSDIDVNITEQKVIVTPVKGEVIATVEVNIPGPQGPQGLVGAVDRNLDGGFANSIYGGTSGFDGGNA